MLFHLYRDIMLGMLIASILVVVLVIIDIAVDYFMCFINDKTSTRSSGGYKLLKWFGIITRLSDEQELKEFRDVAMALFVLFCTSIIFSSLWPIGVPLLFVLGIAHLLRYTFRLSKKINGITGPTAPARGPEDISDE